MILITKGGVSRGDNEMPTNCLYDCRLVNSCLYVPRWAEENTLDELKISRAKNCPLVEVGESEVEE